MHVYLSSRSFVLGLVLVGCHSNSHPGVRATQVPEDPLVLALQSISGDDVAADVAILASDEFEGRFPGSAGETKTLAHLAARMARLQIAPAPEGYLQPVPLVSTRRDRSSSVVARGPGGTSTWRSGEHVLFGASDDATALEVRTEGAVFVGYGIVAPEQGWDDYDGVDVRGKTVLVLPGDPGPTRNDPEFFGGRALTHHGTFDAKVEHARSRGAAAILSIHDEEGSGIPWAALANSGRQPKMRLREEAQTRAMLRGVLPVARARELLALAGAPTSLDALLQAAATDAFEARSFDVSLAFELRREVEPVDSHNFIGWIRGSERPEEYVVYTAHWDHIGVAPEPVGSGADRIFNGAVDNATGTAALLEVAEAYASLRTPPRRSIVFLATTAEEQGLLGAFHYAEHPVFPLRDTIAVINMDALFPFGRTAGMTLVAPDSSELEPYLERAASAVGRTVVADPAPQLGAFFRSDHYPFAAKGVPALFAVGGPNPAPNSGETVDLARFQEFVSQHYHQVSDEYEPSRWDMAGIAQDVEVYFRTGYAIAQDDRVPNWYPHSEFRALRDAMRSESGSEVSPRGAPG